MPSNGLPIGRGRSVGNPKFLRSFLHDGSYFGQVDVAHLREQVVLNLMIQASAKPGEQTTSRAKIGCGQQLVGQGVDIEHGSFLSRVVVMILHHMRRLKNDGKNEPSDNLHENPPKNDLEPMDATEQHRKQHDVGEVHGFGDGE